MEALSVKDFGEDEIEKMQSLSALDILAVVAQKALLKDYPPPSSSSSSSSLWSVIYGTKPTIDMPMSEKKPLLFDLNVKPRTQRRPRSTPIDVHALLPCLRWGSNFDECESSQAPKKRPITDVVVDMFSSRDCRTNPDEYESSRVSKKRRVIALPPPLQPLHPELPVDFRQKIEEIGGSDVRFVIQKRLYDADVQSNKSRLTMPYRQCKVDFGEVERTQVNVIHKDGNNLREVMMTFLRWDTVSSYVFNGSWNDLVKTSGLHRDDVVQVWSYKLDDELAFALVKL